METAHELYNNMVGSVSLSVGEKWIYDIILQLQMTKGGRCIETCCIDIIILSERCLKGDLGG